MDCWCTRGVFALMLVGGCGGDDSTATAGSASGEGSASEGSTASTAGATTGGSSGGSTDSTGQGREDSGSASRGSQTGGDDCDCMAGGYAPVCGVDGMTYDSICGIECVPVEIACEGECPCSGFMCGEMECAAGEAVCTTTVGGPAGSRPTHQCGTVPKSCLPDPDCGCFPKIGCMCAEDPENFFNIECSAP